MPFAERARQSKSLIRMIHETHHSVVEPLLMPLDVDTDLPFTHFRNQATARYEQMRATAFRRRCQRFAGVALGRFGEAARTEDCETDIAACDDWFLGQLKRYFSAA